MPPLCGSLLNPGATGGWDSLPISNLSPQPSCFWAPTCLSSLPLPGRKDEEGQHQLYKAGSLGQLWMSNRPLFWELSPEEAESESQGSAGHQAHARSLAGEDAVRSWPGWADLEAKRWRHLSGRGTVNLAASPSISL